MARGIGRALKVLPLVLAGDLQGAMLKLHSAPEPAPRPAKAEPPPASRTAAAPDKPKKAPKPAEAETPAQAGKPVKAGGLGAFLKKLLPDSDPARQK